MKILFLLISLFFVSESHGALEAELSIYSNFIWRGTTFTENKPAIQGELDAEDKNGLFVGTFISNAEFSDDAFGSHAQVTSEIDGIVGKRWYGEDWEMQIAYSQFTFPDAWVFNTDEWNFQGRWKNYVLELSYMDDFFGAKGPYKYVRVGYEWNYKPSVDGALFVGFNMFDKPKGGLKSTCMDATCSTTAQSTSGAGNTDYFDVFFINRKVFKNHQSVELAFNWTNRYEYTAENDEITKRKAKDFAVILGWVYPFSL